MSTLTALQQHRDLDLARLADQLGTRRPRLIRQWVIDATSGRPVAHWVIDSPVPAEVHADVMEEPAFA